MTRINLVPPEELCDQHLLAEHRELTRIPNAVAKGKYHLKGQPAEYKLGEGHVRFFFNKLAGNSQLMQQIIDEKSETEIRESWKEKLDAFKQIRKNYLLYEDF